MNINFKKHLQTELDTIKKDGLYKEERVIVNPQGRSIKVNTGDNVLNFCANNYLGLSSHPDVVKAAKDTLDTHGFGMSSVRFICGTQDIHKELERKIYLANHDHCGPCGNLYQYNKTKRIPKHLTMNLEDLLLESCKKSIHRLIKK